MAISGSDVAAHYQHQAQTLGPLRDGYRKLASELKEADVKLADQLTKARRELAAVYLPELSDEAFARTARLTGFQGFARRDPRAALSHERHVLQQALAKVDSDARYHNRDAAVAQLTGELESARDTLAPLEAECERFESQLGFLELEQIGYDTPAFQEKWWQASYWKHWSAGDRICKALDMSDFGDDVLPAYNKHAEPRNYMRDEVKRIEAQIDAVHELVRERDRNADRLAHLDEIYLAEAQDYLGEHLEHADVALLEQWVAAEPALQRAVQIGLRKLSGIAAKRRFLGEIGGQGVPKLIEQLTARQAKAFAKVMKFQRPKHAYGTFQNSMINHEFDEKAAALEQQRDKLSRRVTALVAAENYAGFDLRNDQELWWMYLMQSPPPRLAPSLFDYYQRRPDAQPITDPKVEMWPTPGEMAATAYVAGDLERGTYLS